MPYLASEDADTLDVLFRDEEAQLKRMVVLADSEYIWLTIRSALISKWLQDGKGLMAHKLSPNFAHYNIEIYILSLVELMQVSNYDPTKMT